MAQNHGFRPPSNDRAKLFSKGKNSGSNGGAPFVPSNINMTPPQEPPKPPISPEEIDQLINPTHDYILVEALPQKTTASGLYLPDSASNTEFNVPKYLILKVGPGRVTENGFMTVACCKPGDITHVALNPASSIPIPNELGRPIFLINNMMILGVYPKKKELQSTEQPTLNGIV